MSVLKDIAGRRFWGCAAMTVGIALLITALGAFLIVRGVIPSSVAGKWGCGAWGAACFIGGRSAAAGKNSRLVRSMLNGLVTMGIMGLLGLTQPADKTGETLGWLYAVSCGAAGSLAAAALAPRRAARRKRSGKREYQSSKGKQ